jgi:ABC-type uncharacterized transport system permease subunit
MKSANICSGLAERMKRIMNKRVVLATLHIVAPVIAVFFSLALSSILFLAIGKDPINVYRTMLEFSFGRLDSLGAILFNATPLIFSGIAVAVSFKVGLFNIGVEGQYVIGALCASLVGFSFTGLPAVIHLPLAILAAVLGSMLWALIPIFLKTKRGVHEVISTIMLNYVAYSLIHYFIADVFLDRNQNIPGGLGSLVIRTPKFADSVMMPKLTAAAQLVGIDFPSYVYLNWFFIVALLFAVGIYYLIMHTPFGFEIRAVGYNAKAAEALGINPRKLYTQGFLLSGAVAGMTGLSHLLTFYGYMDLDFPKNLGFNGIAVALMGNNHPVGIVFAAILFGFLNRGAEGVQTLLDVPMESVAIMQGVIIISVVVTANYLARYIRLWEKREV